MPGLGRFVIDALSVALVVGALGAGARGLRLRLLPGRRGAPAWVAEAVLVLAGLVLVAQFLALIGALSTACIVLLSLVLGAAGWLSRGGKAPAAAPGAEEGLQAVGRVWHVTALGAVALTLAQWSSGVWFALRHGMVTNDTVLYHGPEMARLVRGESPLQLSFAHSDPVVSFLPDNSELIHALGAVLLGVDLLSPFLNLAFLGLAFLAAWTIGRPYGVAPVGVTGVALILVSPLLVLSQPGGMYNDIVVIALLLSAIALLLNGADRGWALVLPAAACGLAIGTKVTALAFVGALTLALIWTYGRGRRLRATLLWTATLAVTGGLWYLRNLIRVGNPLPGLEVEAGPLSTPNPPLPHSYSIVHYIGDAGIWDRAFRPALETLLGDAWWAIVALAVAGMALSVLRPGTRLQRPLGLAAAVALVAYLFTPRSGGGFDVVANYFPSNIRYATPALSVGLVLLPLVPRVSRAVSRSWTAVVPVAVLVVTVLTAGSSENIGAQLVGAGALLAVAAALLLRGHVPLRLGRRTLALATAGLLALVLVGGWRVERSYLAHRYIYPPWSLGNSLPPRARLGVVGETGTYSLFGAYFTRAVEVVGAHGPHGEFLPIESCPAWRRAVNHGRFEYLVISPRLVTRDESGLTLGSIFGSVTPELDWTRKAPGAEAVYESGDGTLHVYALHRPLDPRTCPAEQEAG